jgi:hypothetical protein
MATVYYIIFLALVVADCVIRYSYPAALFLSLLLCCFCACKDTIPMTIAVVFLPFASFVSHLQTIRITSGFISILGDVRYGFEDEQMLQVVVQKGACWNYIKSLLGN